MPQSDSMRADAESSGAPTRIQKADPVARRRARLLLAAALPLVLVAGLGSELFRARLEELARQSPALAAGQLLLALCIVTTAGVLPLLAFSAWLWRFGQRIRHAGRFPPPGVAVIHDVRILEGRAAKLYGGFGQVMALALVACGLALVWIMALLVECWQRHAAP
jgi:hypothetical protein